MWAVVQLRKLAQPKVLAMDKQAADALAAQFAAWNASRRFVVAVG